MSPSIFLILVCFKLPPRLASRYIGRFFDGVRDMRYGSFGIAAEVVCEGVDVGVEIASFVRLGVAGLVDSLATPRKRRKVVALGRAIGLRNWSDIAEVMRVVERLISARSNLPQTSFPVANFSKTERR